MTKICSFFGHRKIDVTEELKQRIKELIEDLIVNKNVLTFLFGSRSKFDNLCHYLVSQLKEKYPNIKRIAYTCKHEGCLLQSEIENWEQVHGYKPNEKMKLVAVEEEYDHKTKYTAGRASYVERNYAIINDSDYCVFYYDQNYKPERRKCSLSNILTYQPNSGTALSYHYAKQKKKTVINVF